MDGWAGPEELLRDAPTWAPSPAELADLELLLAGAYAPLRGFLGASDVASLRNSGHLTDGTDWPVPVTLETIRGTVTDVVGLLPAADVLPGGRQGR